VAIGRLTWRWGFTTLAPAQADSLNETPIVLLESNYFIG
jgi:hypothetical protein